MPSPKASPKAALPSLPPPAYWLVTAFLVSPMALSSIVCSKGLVCSWVSPVSADVTAELGPSKPVIAPCAPVM